MGKLRIVADYLGYLKITKKWWLTPIIFVLLLLGLLIVFANSSALAPFIYTLF